MGVFVEDGCVEVWVCVWGVGRVGGSCVCDYFFI